jgi:hypothetical protein
MDHPILKSAAKMVFVLLAISACIGLFTGHISEQNFMLLATAAFSFYFANKGDGGNAREQEISGAPYLGK